MQKTFKLREYSNYIASKTLTELEQDVKTYRKAHPATPIYLDFNDTQMQDAFLKKVASICEYSNCECLGLGERYEDVRQFQQTGYFIAQHIGPQAYIKKFRAMVEQADFPLLVWDQRHKQFLIKRLAVIQPLIFTDTHFIFQELNGVYSQPHDLANALRTGAADLFKRHEVHLTDLNTENYCIRFANNLQERSTLDVFEGILTKQIPNIFFAKAR